MVNLDHNGDLDELIDEKVQNAVDKKEVSGSNKITVTSHSITVNLSSEESSMEELVEFADEMMTKREKQSIVGEYAVLEEEDMMGMFLP